MVLCPRRVSTSSGKKSVSQNLVMQAYFQESSIDPDTFEKYRDTPPISIAILLQKYALLLAESSMYTTNLYHDTPPICIATLLQKHRGSLEHSQYFAGFLDL